MCVTRANYCNTGQRTGSAKSSSPQPYFSGRSDSFPLPQLRPVPVGALALWTHAGPLLLSRNPLMPAPAPTAKYHDFYRSKGPSQWPYPFVDSHNLSPKSLLKYRRLPLTSQPHVDYTTISTTGHHYERSERTRTNHRRHAPHLQNG